RGGQTSPPNPLSKGEGEEKAETEKILLSVLVVFRNEEKHLPNLITDLARQDLHKDFWEILWVDDFSDDKSLEIVKKAQSTLPNSRILSNKEFLHILSPKKRGITQAISKAEGKWIVCTDADCRLPTAWLSTILDYFQQSGAYFVSMPIRFETNQHFFSQWQAVELASLIGTGAVCIALHKPTMCNGANIAYQKNVFEQVGGFRAYSFGR
ncbi:MAG: glycosyltransferase, partial [Raineya sp.]|nr:glycosyltransferase [Raineya sp.]